MGRFYRDEIIAKSVKVGDRNTNVELGFVKLDEHGEVVGSYVAIPFLPEGTPVEPESAVAVLGESNAEVTFTAVVPGTDAEKWSIEILDPGVDPEDQDLEILIDDEEFVITIDPKVETKTITTTATALVTAFNLVEGMDDIVVASVESGTGNDPIEPEGPTNLDNGVDGLPGPKGLVVFGEDFVYVNIDDSTEAESNWKKIALADLDAS